MEGVNATAHRARGCPAVTWVDSPIYLRLADWASGVQASGVHDEVGPGTGLRTGIWQWPQTPNGYLAIATDSERVSGNCRKFQTDNKEHVLFTAAW